MLPCYASLWFIMKYIVLLSLLQAQAILHKKKLTKCMGEIIKEFLKSLVKEKSEDTELIHTPENVLNFQEHVACMTQYKKQLQNKKASILHNLHNVKNLKNHNLHNLKNWMNLLTL